jgi:hypothetical protein
VKRILDEAHERARTVLDENSDLLERIAQALLERETLDRDQIETLERGEPLRPLPDVGMPTSGATLAAARPEPAPTPPLALPGGDGPLPGPAPGIVETDGGERLPS